MLSFSSFLIFSALVAVVVLLGYGLLDAWRHVLRQSALPPPFAGMLRLAGLTPGEAREALGVQTLAAAMRDCARCAAEPGCQARLAAGEAVPGDCPNTGLFAALQRPRA